MVMNLLSHLESVSPWRCDCADLHLSYSRINCLEHLAMRPFGKLPVSPGHLQQVAWMKVVLERKQEVVSGPEALR